MLLNIKAVQEKQTGSQSSVQTLDVLSYFPIAVSTTSKLQTALEHPAWSSQIQDDLGSETLPYSLCLD